MVSYKLSQVVMIIPIVNSDNTNYTQNLFIIIPFAGRNSYHLRAKFVWVRVCMIPNRSKFVGPNLRWSEFTGKPMMINSQFIHKRIETDLLTVNKPAILKLNLNDSVR